MVNYTKCKQYLSNIGRSLSLETYNTLMVLLYHLENKGLIQGFLLQHLL